MDVEPLTAKFPPNWHKLFKICMQNGRGDPVKKATCWLQEHMSWQNPDVLSWQQLCVALCDPEPMSRGVSLTFLPRLWHFPVYMQRHLLSFLHLHQRCVLPSILHELVSELKPTAPDDYWIRMLLHMLQSEADCRLQPPEQDDKFTMSPMTPDGLIEAEHCLQLLASTAGPTTCWGPWQKQDSSMDVSICATQSQFPVAWDADTPVGSQTLGGSQIQMTQGSSQLQSTQMILSDEDDDDTTDQLSDEVMVGLQELSDIWRSGSSEAPPPQLSLLPNIMPGRMAAACKQLDLSNLSEAAIATACDHLSTLSDSLSHANTICFTQHCLLPKILALERSASRQLQSTVCSFAETFPSSVVDAVFHAMIKEVNLSSSHSELLIKVIKESLSSEHNQKVIRLVCDAESWTDGHLLLLQACLVTKGLELTPDVVKVLAAALERHSTSQAKNVKFGKLLQTVLTKHSNQLEDNSWRHISEAVSGHKSFLAKSLAASVNKITKAT